MKKVLELNLAYDNDIPARPFSEIGFYKMFVSKRIFEIIETCSKDLMDNKTYIKVSDFEYISLSQSTRTGNVNRYTVSPEDCKEWLVVPLVY